MLFAALWLGGNGFVYAQTPLSDEDFDAVIVPVGVSAHASGKDFSAAIPQDMGLNLLPVDNYPMGMVELTFTADQLTIRLKAGEAIRFWSDPIPVSPSTVLFTCNVAIAGATPEQAAAALVDGVDMNRLGVNLTYGKDIPMDGRDYSLEYECLSDQAILLLQFVGPKEGESSITVKRLRMLSNFSEREFALGSTALTATEDFGKGMDFVLINKPPSTEGGIVLLNANFNRSIFPASTAQALLLGTQSPNDVIQVLAPLPLKANSMDLRTNPVKIYAQAYVRRVRGTEGIFSIALFSGATGTVGYVDYPVASLPGDAWMRVECPVLFTEEGAQAPMMILQVRGGSSGVAIDDISLQARMDSPYFWDADMILSASGAAD
ncbi:MAG: hypothetical protein AB1656_02700 [Candidatus Omnitrophota bacterium]